MIMMHLKDTLSARRTERAAQRRLADELTGFSSPSDRLEIETIAARYSDDDAREVREILVRLAA